MRINGGLLSHSDSEWLEANKKDMTDKEVLQKITAMINDYVNNPKEGLLNPKAERLINNLKKVVEKVDSC